MPPTLTETAIELKETPAEQIPAAADLTDAVDDKDDNVFEDEVNMLKTEVVDNDDIPQIMIENKPSHEQGKIQIRIYLYVPY